jgi:hypothetical protein
VAPRKRNRAARLQRNNPHSIRKYAVHRFTTSVCSVVPPPKPGRIPTAKPMIMPKTISQKVVPEKIREKPEPKALPISIIVKDLKIEFYGPSKNVGKPLSNYLKRISFSLANRVGSSLKIPATVFSNSSPVTGFRPIWAFFVSLRNSLSFNVSWKALRSICTRSFGVPGGRTNGRENMLGL